MTTYRPPFLPPTPFIHNSSLVCRHFFSSMSSLTPSFSPLALSRSNQQRYRKNLSQKPNPQLNSKSKPKPKSKSLSSDEKPSSSSSISVEATTYTRLPPKDDFLAASLIDAFQEIKLSESTLVEKPTKEGQVGSVRSGGELSGFKFEDYEVGEEEEFDEEDDDFDEEDDDGEMVVFGGEEFEEFEEEDEKEKEKGVPAVMRCFDRAKIYVKAGNGGNGVVAFRREKFVPLGGPSGGDGGRGGNVYVEVDGDMNSLLPFRNGSHFRAGRGAHGRGRNQHGAKGEDVVVKVASGTVIREAREEGGEGEVLLELLHPGQRALLLPGGRGGRGNAAFKSGLNKVPKIAEKGEEGPEM